MKPPQSLLKLNVCWINLFKIYANNNKVWLICWQCRRHWWTSSLEQVVYCFRHRRTYTPYSRPWYREHVRFCQLKLLFINLKYPTGLLSSWHGNSTWSLFDQFKWTRRMYITLTHTHTHAHAHAQTLTSKYNFFLITRLTITGCHQQIKFVLCLRLRVTKGLWTSSSWLLSFSAQGSIIIMSNNNNTNLQRTFRTCIVCIARELVIGSMARLNISLLSIVLNHIPNKRLFGKKVVLVRQYKQKYKLGVVNSTIYSHVMHTWHFPAVVCN